MLVTERDSTTPVLDENIPEKIQVIFFYTLCCDPFQIYLKEENLKKKKDFSIFKKKILFRSWVKMKMAMKLILNQNL